ADDGQKAFAQAQYRSIHILATGKPSILIPLPTILDHHQTRNAYIMADIMGAMVITEDELDSSSLTSAVDEIF
ncbi:hypothetical protein ACJX0J_016239, partial [Zea mays]